MSKLASQVKKDGAPGKAKQRHDRRQAHAKQASSISGHQHHKPGSMNAKKTGRS